MRAFGQWLATPLRAFRGLFPFSRAGMQTLVYLVFAGAGPALCLFALWIMREALVHRLFGVFGQMAWVVGASLLIITCGLGMFVSIRAVKLGKDGFEASGGGENDQ